MKETTEDTEKNNRKNRSQCSQKEKIKKISPQIEKMLNAKCWKLRAEK